MSPPKQNENSFWRIQFYSWSQISIKEIHGNFANEKSTFTEATEKQTDMVESQKWHKASHIKERKLKLITVIQVIIEIFEWLNEDHLN